MARDRKGKIISGVYKEGTHFVLPVDTCLIEDEKADRIIGTIYGIDCLKPEIQIEETIDENMVGLVYILAKIMYHQDDVFMV